MTDRAGLAAVLPQLIPPHSVETERAVLGAILLEGAEAWSRIGARLEVEDFYLERHRRLWGTYRDLVADDLAIDLVTALDALRPQADDLGVLPAVWLAELAEEAATLTALPSYAALIRRDSARRRMILQASQALSQAYDPGADPAEVAARTAEALGGIAQLAQHTTPAPAASAHLLREAVDEVMAELAAGTAPRLVPTPWPGLNRLLGGGLAASELVYLGGWTSVGKSAWALELARHVARHGRGVLIVSREMSQRLLAQRLLAQEAGIDALSLRAGRLGAGEEVLLRAALPSARGLPIWVSDTAEGVDDVQRLLAPPRAPDVGLVIIDYLQLLRAPAGIRERRHQVEHLSKQCKALAVARDVPVVCLSSLARAGDDHRRPPVLSDLRESGELEHDADSVIFLHRPDRLAPETEAILAKQRNGPVGRVALHFRASSLRFTEVSERASD